MMRSKVLLGEGKRMQGQLKIWADFGNFGEGLAGILWEVDCNEFVISA